MRYCKRCIMPDTKPALVFDNEGICNACRNYENRDNVDWGKRESELIEILAAYKSHDGSKHDCIIPVSGGKDSTFQVLTMLRYGMNPLCITSTTCDLTEIGRRNIENIKSLGVDYIEVSPNKKIRSKLNLHGLKTVGDISWPEHVGIFTIPIRMAVALDIPLIIWGENSQNEYGGPAGSTEKSILDRQWLEEFGGLLGLRVSDLVEEYNYKMSELILYSYPTDDELRNVGVTGLFLGYYVPWDGLSNYLISSLNGFESYPKIVEGSAVSYENLDNYQTGVHDYFKFLKFGFGRASDLLSMQIRRGRISREDAILIVRDLEGQFPSNYLGKNLTEIIKPIGLTLQEFTQICDEFTNRSLFKVDASGDLIKDENGNLVKLKYDN
jgi:N-acetyl sugar amidotransferase